MKYPTMILVAFSLVWCPLVSAGEQAPSNVEWLLEQYTLGREEYVILDEYFNRIGYIRKQMTFKRKYTPYRKIEKRDKTPYEFKGVSTFKERRSHDYGPKYPSRVR